MSVVVEAGASADMALVTAKAASAGAAGIDSLAGIPGTIGGSLRMNAGTDREIGEFVRDGVGSIAEPAGAACRQRPVSLPALEPRT